MRPVVAGNMAASARHGADDDGGDGEDVAHAADDDRDVVGGVNSSALNTSVRVLKHTKQRQRLLGTWKFHEHIDTQRWRHKRRPHGRHNRNLIPAALLLLQSHNPPPNKPKRLHAQTVLRG